MERGATEERSERATRNPGVLESGLTEDEQTEVNLPRRLRGPVAMTQSHIILKHLKTDETSITGEDVLECSHVDLLLVVRILWLCWS